MRFSVLPLLLMLFFFLHLHPSSSSSTISPNNPLSAFSQQPNHVTDKRTLQKFSIRKDRGVKWVEKKGGGGGGGHGVGGHSGGGHASGRGVGSGADGSRGTDPGRINGAGAVIPLYAAGAAGSHHINNNHRHGKSSGTINCIHLPSLALVLLGSILLLLHIQHRLW